MGRIDEERQSGRKGRSRKCSQSAWTNKDSHWPTFFDSRRKVSSEDRNIRIARMRRAHHSTGQGFCEASSRCFRFITVAKGNGQLPDRQNEDKSSKASKDNTG